MVSTEKESCTKFLNGLRDKIRVLLVPLRVQLFADSIDRARMLEQALGLDKKPVKTRVSSKKVGGASSALAPKRVRYFHWPGRFVPTDFRSERCRPR